MTWDLGPGGVGVLLAMALGFGAVAQVLAGQHTTRWMRSIGAARSFVVGSRRSLTSRTRTRAGTPRRAAARRPHVLALDA